MDMDQHEKECQDALSDFKGTKIDDIWFKSFNENCWRLYIITDKGKMVMTFCKEWHCPVVESRPLDADEDEFYNIS